MLLSRTTEYALRIMAAVATSRGAIPLKAKDLSELINCPRHYVSKVLRKLVSAGLLKATKGHGGGFLLAKKAGQIYFSEIMNAVDLPTKNKYCIFGWRQCSSANPCILHYRWDRVNESFVEWAQHTTLEHIQQDAENSQWLLPLKNKK